ncbi:MAG: hypothetical protein Q8Q36_01210, partial [bacterium]|nr:hypothetical protein [bacterium]
KSEEAIPKEIALTVNDILSDNTARAPAFGARGALYIPGRDVAVKTGTTNDYRDAWVLGYTPSLAIGAWAGNNDNSSMHKNVAGFIIAPLWNAFITEALKEYPVERFEKPSKKTDWSLKPVFRGVWWGGKNFIIDKISGKLATPFTPDETKGEVVVRDPHSILYWVDKSNPLGPAPLNPESDPQFRLWEVPVQKWVAAQPFIQGITEAEAPLGYDDVHGPGSLLTISIKEPYQSQSFAKGATMLVKVDNFGRFPVVKVDLFLNNNFIGSSGSLSYSFVLDEYALAGQNELKVVGYDSASNRAESSVGFVVH